ncbi:hypothetical protein F7731_14605 [Cytobacillus depressus]|uniref:DUF3098 domain-containing protein n=1 Tax=Cytobacillus depressus TaxID=1602942 RepID=A0A6L3V4R6_9BACI|nr:hypothetical protein [Cytobacillus depressus]KAB2334442.1 hypothetical protein F7731_14605 [Cytobacillus depressus]
MKKEVILRNTILIIMFLGIIYSIWEAITNWGKGFAGFLPFLLIVPIAVYGIVLFLPRKK